MQYHAKLPTRNSNVSRVRPLQEFATLVVGAASVLFVIYWLSGWLVDYAVESMSDEMVSEIYQSLNRIERDKDEKETSSPQLRHLLLSLKKHSGLDYPISLSIADSTDKNALAFPTGHIVVFQALLDEMNSENGLAFVLAHELAHFKNRDHLRAMGRGFLLISASVFLGLGDSDILQTMSPVTDFTNAQFSQQRETAADVMALTLLNNHYGHIGGATEFFELMQADDEATPFASSHYFSSHPQLQQRIDNLYQLGKSMALVTKETTDFVH